MWWKAYLWAIAPNEYQQREIVVGYLPSEGWAKFVAAAWVKGYEAAGWSIVAYGARHA